MTKLIRQFTIEEAALANGAAQQPQAGVLPKRVQPAIEPRTLVGIVDDHGASTHYEFNQVAGKIFDRLNPTDGCEYVDEVQRSLGAGDVLASYVENRAIRFGTTTANDMVMDASAANDYGSDSTWTLEAFIYVVGTGGTTLAKFDGSQGAAGKGWILRCANPTNTEFEIQFKDSVNTMTIRCNTGVDLTGAVSGPHQFAVTVNGNSPFSLSNSQVELYFDGVQQTKNIINAGPVGNFSLPSQNIESGYFPSGAPIIGAAARKANSFDQFMMYPSVLSGAQLQEHYDIATNNKPLPVATWTHTAAGNETVNAVGVCGMLGNLYPGLDRLFTNQRKVRTYYSVNGGARTEFRESVSGLSVALVASDTFEVIAEWEQANTYDTGLPGWVADACGFGPWIAYDDGAADVDPDPPVQPITDANFGIGAKLEIEEA